MACLFAGRKAVALASLISALATGSHLLVHAQALPTAPPNLETRIGYDALGRIVEVIDPRGGTTRIGYDGTHAPTQVTDPRGLVTRYPRNGFGKVQRRISPDTGIDHLTYDAARNLKTRTDSRGVLTTYGYDASDRLTSAVHTKSGSINETVNLAYSQTGPEFSYGVGRLTSSSYAGGSARYGYNAQGKLIHDLQQVDASTGANSIQLDHMVAYGYTLDRLTTITYPSGRILSQTWVDGEMTAIALDAKPLVTQIEWTPFAMAVRRWRWAMAGGPKLHERYFDLAGRMIRHPLGNLLRDLRYDAANRLVSFTHLMHDGTPQPALDQSFSHDENDRLTRITTATSSWSISYDANDNRTSVNLNGDPSLYNVESSSNRLTGSTNPARTFSHDDAGNTTIDSAGYTATYNLRGQLATITKGGVTTAYTYNAAGRRVRKVSSTGPQSTVIFAYDPSGQLLGEYDRNGAALREYVWLRDTPIAMFMPDPLDPRGEPLIFYIHTDHLDAPRIVLDRNNNQRWRWVAEPFGTTAPETNPQGLGDFTQNLRFPGQYADAESGLWYNHFRNYEKESGRYTQSDPIGLAGGSMSTYTYVAANPLHRIDPTGLETCVVVTKTSWGFRDHAALYMSQGGDKGGPFLFDPSGSYARSHGGGTGDFIEGRYADLDLFAKHHRESIIEKTCQDTPLEEEQRIAEKIIVRMDSPGAAQCSSNVSTALDGSPYFPRVKAGTVFPGNLYRAAGGQ
jgi:RHS repeat-associated protein